MAWCLGNQKCIRIDSENFVLVKRFFYSCWNYYDFAVDILLFGSSVVELSYATHAASLCLEWTMGFITFS